MSKRRKAHEHLRRKKNGGFSIVNKGVSDFYKNNSYPSNSSDIVRFLLKEDAYLKSLTNISNEVQTQIRERQKEIGDELIEALKSATNSRKNSNKETVNRHANNRPKK